MFIVTPTSVRTLWILTISHVANQRLEAKVLCFSPQLGRNDRAEPDEDLLESCLDPVRAPEGRESVRRQPADFGPTAEHRSHQDEERKPPAPSIQLCCMAEWRPEVGRFRTTKLGRLVRNQAKFSLR